MQTLPDVVYPYKSAPYDFELRYSLRSLANVPHGRVIIGGDRPKIINDSVKHVPVAPVRDRYRSSTANILAACEASDASQVIVMNDDIFILRPWVFEHENRGSISEYLRAGSVQGGYRAALERTNKFLVSKGIENPLFYGLHTPTVYNRVKMVDLIRSLDGDSMLLRTVYHNLYPQPSTREHDVKKRGWSDDINGTVLSITDGIAEKNSFRRWIDARFPDRCQYERGGRCLILGRGPRVWDDLRSVTDFDVVIALREPAEHWPSVLLAVAKDEQNAEFIAESYGFHNPTWCGKEVV